MAAERNLSSALRRLPLFNDLSEDELALIGERVTIHSYDAGAIIFSEGDICRELMIVSDGAVKILKPKPQQPARLTNSSVNLDHDPYRVE